MNTDKLDKLHKVMELVIQLNEMDNDITAFYEYSGHVHGAYVTLYRNYNGESKKFMDFYGVAYTDRNDFDTRIDKIISYLEGIKK